MQRSSGRCWLLEDILAYIAYLSHEVVESRGQTPVFNSGATMNALTDDAALAYLQKAFSNGYGSQRDEDDLRHQMDADIASRVRRMQASNAAESKDAIPAGLTVLQRRYLEAVRRHAVAKEQHEAVVASIRDGQASRQVKRPKHDPDSGLSSYLELLRHRRQQERLGTIRSYLAKLDRLNEELRSTEAESEPGDAFALAQTAVEPSRAVDISAIHSMVTNLETAVIKSDSEARQERSHLSASRSSVTSLQNLDPASEAYALSAVRDELTRWIEQSLAKCADGDRHDAEMPANDGSITITAQDVHAEYEKYLVARKRLLSALECLQVPATLNDAGKALAQTAPPTITDEPPADQALAVEASQHQRQIGNNMRQIQSHLDGELDREKEESLEALLRLVDESQLLPAYPVLAKNERFGKITSSLGTRPQTQSDNKITEQIEAWTFAANAADKSLEAAINSQVTKATKALDEVDKMLGDMKILHGQTD